MTERTMTPAEMANYLLVRQAYEDAQAPAAGLLDGTALGSLMPKNRAAVGLFMVCAIGHAWYFVVPQNGGWQWLDGSARKARHLACPYCRPRSRTKVSPARGGEPKGRNVDPLLMETQDRQATPRYTMTHPDVSGTLAAAFRLGDYLPTGQSADDVWNPPDPTYRVLWSADLAKAWRAYVQDEVTQGKAKRAAEWRRTHPRAARRRRSRRY